MLHRQMSCTLHLLNPRTSSELKKVASGISNSDSAATIPRGGAVKHVHFPSDTELVQIWEFTDEYDRSPAEIQCNPLALFTGPHRQIEMYEYYEADEAQKYHDKQRARRAATHAERSQDDTNYIDNTYPANSHPTASIAAYQSFGSAVIAMDVGVVHVDQRIGVLHSPKNGLNQRSTENDTTGESLTPLETHKDTLTEHEEEATESAMTGRSEVHRVKVSHRLRYRASFPTMELDETIGTGESFSFAIWRGH